jgi:hypothetical protein
MSMIMTNEKEASGGPDPRLAEAIGKHVEEMARAGVLIATGGLGPSAMGARVYAANGKLSVVDGPFAEATEFVGGFAIMQAKSKEEAVEYARRFLKIHVDVLGTEYNGVCEVRPIFGPEDLDAPA